MFLVAAESLSSAPSAYAIAAIAGAGAILGAVISSSATLASSGRAAKSQLAVLESQLQHATAERVRMERRKCYADFLDIAERVNLLTVEISAVLAAEYSLTGGRVERRAWGTWPEVDRILSGFSQRRTDLWEEWRAAHVQVRLLATWQVLRLSDALMALYEGEMDSLWEGMEPYEDGFRPEDVAGPNELLEAMQRDLGVMGGVEADPGPGILP